MIALYILCYTGFQHKESAVDPTLADLGFFCELGDAIIVNDHLSESCGWPYGGYCYKFGFSVVKVNQLWNIHIAYTIPIGKHKCLVSNKISYLLDTPARVCICSCIKQVNNPIFAFAIVY